MINDLLNDTGLEKDNHFLPQVDISETEKEFEIQLAMPGMKKDDFKIEINEDNLIISGERKFNKEEKGKKFHKVETSFGTFSRSFVLPKNIDQDKIKASYEEGILSLVLPKNEKTSDRKIKIQ